MDSAALVSVLVTLWLSLIGGPRGGPLRPPERSKRRNRRSRGSAKLLAELYKYKLKLLYGPKTQLLTRTFTTSWRPPGPTWSFSEIV